MYIRSNGISYCINAFQIFPDRYTSYFHFDRPCSFFQIFLHLILEQIQTFSIFIIAACYICRYAVIISSKHLTDASSCHFASYIPEGYVNPTDCPCSKAFSAVHFWKIHFFPYPFYIKRILSDHPFL